VSIWVEPFEQHRHPVGPSSSELGCEIRFFCKSDPEKMAMATRHAEGLWTHEVRRLPQWVSDSLTVWIWVQNDNFSLPCKGLEEGVSALALAMVPTPCKLQWQ
jgi:hypothetical protein